MQKVFLATVTLSLLTLSCESYDLGQERQQSFSVNSQNPDFETDIAPIIAAKCTSCHTSKRDVFVPANTPTDDEALNALHVKENFSTKTGRIKTRIFETPSNPMPPRFATQLSDEEKSAIANYIAKTSASSVSEYCAGLTTTKTHSDVKPVLSANCESCHSQGVTDPVLTTLQDVTENRLRMIDQLGRKTMPPRSAGATVAFDTSEERLELLAWLCAGSDVR